MAFSGGALLVAVMLMISGCAPAVQPTSAREDAFRENNRGVAALEQYAYGAAAQSFRRAIALDAQVALPQVNLAIALYYEAKLEEAAVAAAAARVRWPDSPHAAFIDGLTARGLNRPADAVAAFTRVLQIDPQDAGAMINLGQTYALERREGDAIPLFRAAVALEPANATALYSLSQALMRTGAAREGADAAAAFERMRESGAAVTYSQTYLEQGRYAEALVSTGLEGELVDPTTPAVRFSDQTLPWVGAAASAPAALALADLDRDGRLELITSDDRGVHVRRWSGARFDTDLVASDPLNSRVTGIVAADLNNDNRTDLLTIRPDGLWLWQQAASGTLAPVSSRLSTAAGIRTAAVFDADHDGDLDVLSGRPSGLRLDRNNGDGMLVDITPTAQVQSTGLPVALSPTDFDNRRDIDVLALVEGHAPHLFQNQRDGSFRDVAGDVGLGTLTGGLAIAAGDLNKDGYTDFFVAKGAARADLALSTGRGRFLVSPGPQGSEGLTGVQTADYDNDGLLDVVGTGARGLAIFRNLGGRFVDVTPTAIGQVPGARDPLGPFAIGDIDGDGDSDVAALTMNGALRLFRNDGGSANRSILLRLRGVVSNRSAIGAKVDVRAGSLWQRFETIAATPPVMSVDLAAGLGSRASADVVRVLWPAGILQAEEFGTSTAPRLGSPIVITELNRKPSSCPYLYSWNGNSFAFATDFLGGGELGYWTGIHGWSTPDGDEYVRLTDAQLRPRRGRLELRVTNELEEVLYLDHLQLRSVDHPPDVEVFPREGMRGTPQQGLALAAVRNVRPVSRVPDGRYAVTDIRGYARPHALVLDPGEVPARGGAQVLLLTGRTDYAFSSDNVAAAQRGWSLDPPRLEIRRPGGDWRPFAADIGVPVGRPQTLVVDIGKSARQPGTQFRLITNMQIHWDSVRLADLATDVALHLRTHDRESATLAWRGYSAETAGGGQPWVPDYTRVSPMAPWKVLPGRYTREGDVGPLLIGPDDLFVVARTGDELALAFSEGPGLPHAWWRRTFLLRAEGFSKEMDLNSSSPDHVLPLPFRGVTAYPSTSPSTAVRDRQRDMLDRFNTRIVTRAMPISIR